MIDSDIYKLRQPLQSRVLALLDDAKKELPNLFVFETVRSEYRQAQLYGLGRNKAQMMWTYPGKPDYWCFNQPYSTKRTWTTKSKHLTGDACDFAFKVKGRITWEGDWDKFLKLAKKHKLKSLYPYEKCHLEYDKKYDLTLDLMKKIIKLSKRLWSSANNFKLQVDDFQSEMAKIQSEAHDIAEEARK